MKSNLFPMIASVIVLFLILPEAQATIKTTTKSIGAYQILLSLDNSTVTGTFKILQHGREVFSESGLDDRFTFGNSFDESAEGRAPYSGKILTGTGNPILFVSKWTGGAHCCNFLYLFELGPRLKKLTIVSAGSSPIKIIDLDQDGLPEIEFWEGSIDYIFASFARSPGGRVVLKYRQGQYQVAKNLMEKAAPSKDKIKILITKLKTAFSKEESPELPYDFLKTMMDLSYSGHLDLAMSIADRSWPKQRQGLGEFKRDFLAALRESKYWSELRLLN